MQYCCLHGLLFPGLFLRFVQDTSGVMMIVWAIHISPSMLTKLTGCYFRWDGRVGKEGSWSCCRLCHVEKTIDLPNPRDLLIKAVSSCLNSCWLMPVVQTLQVLLESLVLLLYMLNPDFGWFLSPILTKSLQVLQVLFW